MRKQASNRSSLSSRLSRDSDNGKDNIKRPQSGSLRSGSLRNDSKTKASREEDHTRSRLSRYSKDSRSSIYDEDKASFYERCKAAYLMVFDETKDEVTSPEELMLCKKQFFIRF